MTNRRGYVARDPLCFEGKKGRRMMTEIQLSALLGRVVGCSRSDSIVLTTEFGVSSYDEEFLLKNCWTVLQKLHIPAVTYAKRFAAVTESRELLLWTTETRPVVSCKLPVHATLVALSEECVGVACTNGTIVFFPISSARNNLCMVEGHVFCLDFHHGMFRAVCGHLLKTFKLRRDKRQWRANMEIVTNFDQTPTSACFCGDEVHVVTSGKWRGQNVDRLVPLDSDFVGCVVPGRGLQVWKGQTLLCSIDSMVRPGGFVVEGNAIRVMDLKDIRRTALFANNVRRHKRKNTRIFDYCSGQVAMIRDDKSSVGSFETFMWRNRKSLRLATMVKNRFERCGDVDMYAAAFFLEKFLPATNENIRFANQNAVDSGAIISILKPASLHLRCGDVAYGSLVSKSEHMEEKTVFQNGCVKHPGSCKK